jgi:hypothetical protein
LKKDIEILSQTFERIIDRKEAIIKSLVKDIEEAEEQYEMALRSHLQNQDNLIGMDVVRWIFWGYIGELNINKTKNLKTPWGLHLLTPNLSPRPQLAQWHHMPLIHLPSECSPLPPP